MGHKSVLTFLPVCTMNYIYKNSTINRIAGTEILQLPMKLKRGQNMLAIDQIMNHTEISEFYFLDSAFMFKRICNFRIYHWYLY